MKLSTISFLATTPINVRITNGTDEQGSKKVVATIDTVCRFEESSTVGYSPSGEKVVLKGKVFVFDKLDEFPNEPFAAGFCSILSTSYDISSLSRKRNVDGSINHIVLELI